MNKKLLTVCFVQTNDQILLGMKKRGFGEGKWNGFGGKVQVGESIETAAKREVKEEAGIDVTNLKKHGVLSFEFKGVPEILEMHVFSTRDFQGEPRESEEMKPQWFSINEIPFHAMWADDQHWLPHLLVGKKFAGGFFFEEETILNHNLTIFDI